MLLFSQYFNLFIICSVIGWIYECTYCAIRGKHWDNRGFLYGPVCPIYGVGIIGFLMICHRLRSFGIEYSAIPWWIIFLSCMFGSAVMEYLTSYALEKLFHARWWDYRDMPLNIRGRICLPASLFFGAAGVLFSRIIFPYMEGLLADFNFSISAQEILSLILMAVFAADLALTVDSLLKLTEKLDQMEQLIDTRMENAVRLAGNPKQLLILSEHAVEKLSGQALAIAAELSAHQKQILGAIRTYSSEKTSKATVQLKEAIKAISVRIKEH